MIKFWVPYGGLGCGGWPLKGGVGMATGDKDVLMDGSGSRDDERDDMIDPGAESLELRLVLLCGRSGAGTALLRGGMTPNGRT